MKATRGDTLGFAYFLDVLRHWRDFLHANQMQHRRVLLRHCDCQVERPERGFRSVIGVRGVSQGRMKNTTAPTTRNTRVLRVNGAKMGPTATTVPISVTKHAPRTVFASSVQLMPNPSLTA